MERLQQVVRQLRLELQGWAQDGWQGSLKGAQRQTQVTLRHMHSCTSMAAPCCTKAGMPFSAGLENDNGGLLSRRLSNAATQACRGHAP